MKNIKLFKPSGSANCAGNLLLQEKITKADETTKQK